MALQSFTLCDLRIIMEKQLQIPYYQREYAWEKEEYEDLWNDLEDTMSEENGNKHFFGQIVVHSKPDLLTIIDGQQRITTSVILMACLIHNYKDLYDLCEDKTSEMAYDMNYDLVSYQKIIGIRLNKDYLNQKPNLKQNETDQDFFLKVISRDEALKKKQPKKSQERMRKAFNYFNDQIKTKIKDKNFDEKKELLEAFITTLSDKFQVMYIEATELDEAFTIFETLNARGKDLASADLLKNHLFSTGKDIDMSNKLWNKMLETLEDIDMTKFIRAFWNSRQDFIREKALYKTIQSFVRNKKQSKDLLNALYDYSFYYHDLVKPSEANTFQNDRLIEALKNLNILKASSFYPILLAMVSKKSEDGINFTENDMAMVAERLECYVFRNAAICGQTANTTEILFAKIARNIYGEELSSVKDICAEINKEIVSDIEFENSFENFSTNNKDRIRYIFRKIHNHLDHSNELNLNNSEVHIEHIMPEDYSQWGNVDDSVHEEYLWHLGNLCLLSGPMNISISNKPFDKKKEEAYACSKIEPNKELCSYDCWDEKTIVDRQKHLYTYASEIWPKE